MRPGEYLDNIYRDLVPSTQEERTVQARIDQVVAHARRNWRVAEVHPAGSWAKGTMLAGRKEADIIVVLSSAPDSQTLDELARDLQGHTGLRHRPDTSTKAVQLAFDDGVSIDLLPVARQGRTPDGPSVPRKLRHALSGIEHVRWFRERAHGSSLQPLARLFKHLRNCHPGDMDVLSSFSIEVLCVERLPRGLDLYAGFDRLLRDLQGGWLDRAALRDPANANNDLLGEVSAGERRRVADRADRVLSAVAANTWSAVFPSDSRGLPSPARNLGGRTLG